MAVTSQARGTLGTERGTTGYGHRPKLAPSSPGWTTVVTHPRLARGTSGSSIAESQGIPASSRNSSQKHIAEEVNIARLMAVSPRQLPEAERAVTILNRCGRIDSER